MQYQHVCMIRSRTFSLVCFDAIRVNEFLSLEKFRGKAPLGLPFIRYAMNLAVNMDQFRYRAGKQTVAKDHCRRNMPRQCRTVRSNADDTSSPLLNRTQPSKSLQIARKSKKRSTCAAASSLAGKRTKRLHTVTSFRPIVGTTWGLKVKPHTLMYVIEHLREIVNSILQS